MKRISFTLMCLCAAAWTSGCCHSHYSRYADWDDGCDCNQTPKKSRSRFWRGDKSSRNVRNEGCAAGGCNEGGGDCCNPRCGESGGQAQSSPPMSYDGGAALGGGCGSGNCGSNTMPSGTPMYSGNGYSGNGYSGTGGMPFPPGEGWTIQSTTSQPIGNEPYQAPGSTPTPIRPTPITPTPANSQGWTNPSSVPVPAPVPPPVSYNRY